MDIEIKELKVTGPGEATRPGGPLGIICPGFLGIICPGFAGIICPGKGLVCPGGSICGLGC